MAAGPPNNGFEALGAMMIERRTFAAFAMALALSACASTGLKVSDSEFTSLENRIDQHISVLASDEFAGRRPGTIGETKTLDYMRSVLEPAGFVSGTNDPANPWNAPVLLANIKGESALAQFKIGRRVIPVDPEAIAAATEARRALMEDADTVFVGYADGDIDEAVVSGRVVIMLSDPGESPARRAALREKGPVAVVTVVESAESTAQIRQFQMRDRLILASQADEDVSVFLAREALANVLGEARWAELLELADASKGTNDFVPIPLNAKLTLDIRTDRREVPSRNFLAKLPGTNPDAGAVLLLGHWDHFGECGPEGAEDRLCNGAVDNASGIGLMMELGKRLAAGEPMERDLYILGTTAEEWGLLGAQAFADQPPLPLENIVAAFNFDTVAVSPRGSPVGFIGEGRTPLDVIIKEAISDIGRELAPRELSEPFLQRQDGWALLQRDVPSVLLSNAFGSEDKLTEFLSGDYHQASDNPGDIELGGAVDDLLLHELLIRRVANSAVYP